MEELPKAPSPYGRFVDAILIASDFYKRYLPAVSERPVRIEATLVPAIERYISDVTGSAFSIEILAVAPDDEAEGGNAWLQRDLLRGSLLRYPDRAVVRHKAHLNYCWQRFVVTKELAHLLCDSKEQYSNTRATTSGLIDELLGISTRIEPSLPMVAENFAVVTATQMLLPEYLCGELMKMREDGKTNYEIADHFKVPEKIIELRLQPNYIEVVQRFAFAE